MKNKTLLPWINALKVKTNDVPALYNQMSEAYGNVSFGTFIRLYHLYQTAMARKEAYDAYIKNKRDKAVLYSKKNGK